MAQLSPTSQGHSASDDDDDYYDYDEVDPYVEQDRSISEQRSPEAFDYKELKVCEVEDLLNKEVEVLCNAIQVPVSIARLFLLTNDWDIEHVKAQFLADPISVLVSQHLLPTDAAERTVSDSPAVMAALDSTKRIKPGCLARVKSPQVSTDDACAICLATPSPFIRVVEFFRDPVTRGSKSAGDSVTESSSESKSDRNLLGLSCDHRYCVDCWKSHLTTQIDSGFSVKIKCMAPKCDLVVPEDLVLSLLKCSPAKETYLKQIFSRMVTAHRSLRFCVGPECPMVICALEPSKPRSVCCSICKSQFCFQCAEAYHAPLSCETLKCWLAHCFNDTGNSIYMNVHTKVCPKCNVCIEKNGGCNHMQCVKCHHNFCWMCMQKWESHGSQYYTCSKYVDTDADSRKIAEKELQRYVFYYDRWANHERSLQLEKKHRAAVTARIERKVMNKDGTWIDWQYLLTAADTLHRCRYTLKYTYPMAYYPETLKNKDLFEYQQGLLEKEVEDLAWKIEHAEITDRANLQSAMEVCEKHRITLLQEFLT